MCAETAPTTHNVCMNTSVRLLSGLPHASRYIDADKMKISNNACSGEKKQAGVDFAERERDLCYRSYSVCQRYNTNDMSGTRWSTYVTHTTLSRKQGGRKCKKSVADLH
jgi:hypothetical protein